MMAMSQQQFCLRWNNHQKNMIEVFGNLYGDATFVDVTLACDGQLFKAHRMVLSACSAFFHDIFVNNPCKHPVIILKDVKHSELKAILEFMYKGEINVSQDELSTLLKTAESLKVKGLAELPEQQDQQDTQQQQPPQQPINQRFTQSSDAISTKSVNKPRDVPQKSNVRHVSSSPPCSPSPKRNRFRRGPSNVLPAPEAAPVAVEQPFHTQNPEFVEAPIPSESDSIMTNLLHDQIEVNQDQKPLQIKQSPHSPDIEEIEQTDDFNVYSYMEQSGAKNDDSMNSEIPSVSRDSFNEPNECSDNSMLYDSNMDMNMSGPSTSECNVDNDQNAYDPADATKSYKQWSRQNLNQAVVTVLSGEMTSKKVAKKYCLPRTTLRRYVKIAKEMRKSKAGGDRQSCPDKGKVLKEGSQSKQSGNHDNMKLAGKGKLPKEESHSKKSDNPANIIVADKGKIPKEESQRKKSDNPDNMKIAVKELLSGKGSITIISKKYSVSMTALWRHAKRANPHFMREKEGDVYVPAP